MRVYIRLFNASGTYYYRAQVSRKFANRHDNGRLVSCGWTVDARTPAQDPDLPLRAFKRLLMDRLAIEVTQLEWRHSACQSRCTQRGDLSCHW